MKRILHLWILAAAVMLVLVVPIFAQEASDTITVFGLDANSIIVALTSLLALALGIISFMAYRRDGRSKYLFVVLAFLLFALKGVLLVGSDLFSLTQPFLDITAHLLDFGVLLCFFAGIIKK